MSECSAPDIPAASVDSCLERVRILEETESSPDLVGLEARLEARVAADHEPVGPVPAGSGVVEVQPYSAAPAGAGYGSGSPDQTAAAQSATGVPRSLESEGPPAVPPADAAAGDDGEGAAIPNDEAPADANATADNPPPDISPDDEPPIADPPDSDAAPQTDGRGAPPGGPG